MFDDKMKGGFLFKENPPPNLRGELKRRVSKWNSKGDFKVEFKKEKN